MALNGLYPVLLVSTDSGGNAEEIARYRELALVGGNLDPKSATGIEYQELQKKFASESMFDKIKSGDFLTAAFPLIFDGTVIQAVAKSYASSMTKRVEKVGGNLLMRSAGNTVNVQITYKSKKGFGKDPVTGLPFPSVIDSIIALADYFYSQPSTQPQCAFFGGNVAIPSGYLVGISHGEIEDSEEGTITLTIQKNIDIDEITAKKTDKDPTPLVPLPEQKVTNNSGYQSLFSMPRETDYNEEIFKEFNFAILEDMNLINGTIYPELYSEYTVSGELVRYDSMPEYAIPAFGYKHAITYKDYHLPLMLDGSISRSSDNAVCAMLYDDKIYLGVSKTIAPIFSPETSAISEAFDLHVVEKLPTRALFYSITPYVGMTRDVARLESYMTTQLGSLYYAQDIGFDFSYWLNSDIKFQNQTLVAWLTNEALIRAGIVTTYVNVRVEDFILHIDYVIAGNSSDCLGGSTFWNIE